MSKILDHDDLVAKGFHRLDSKLLTNNPPKIAWGSVYVAWTDGERLSYVEKLACTMNHAAMLIQNERNQLLELCEQKEAQLTSIKRSLDANNEMIQQQVTTMNADRQKYNAAIAKLNQVVRDLKAEKLAHWPPVGENVLCKEGLNGGAVD
jgi:hypothetical protein